MKLKIALAALAASTATVAGAAPTVWAGNGHAYEYIGNALTWEQALAAAAGAPLFNGQKGYLATITSAAENAYVSSLSGGSFWLGGSDRTVGDTWIWEAGPEQGTVFWNGKAGGSSPVGAYANWSGGEPNDAGGETGLQGNWSGSAWNDLNGGAQMGYVVEYGGLIAAVPEPGTWGLMILGFGAVGWSMRRRRKTTLATA